MIMVSNEMTQCFEASADISIRAVLDMSNLSNFQPLAGEAFESTCKHLWLTHVSERTTCHVSRFPCLL